MTILLILGSAGGIVAILTAILVVGRGIFHQVSAVEELTRAVQDLAHQMAELRHMLNSHETRLSVLEDRSKR